MSLTVLMALCILGLDLLIYVFFHRIYSDKRNAVARQVAAFKGQSPSRSASLHKKPFMGAKSPPIEGYYLLTAEAPEIALRFREAVRRTIQSLSQT